MSEFLYLFLKLLENKPIQIILTTNFVIYGLVFSFAPYFFAELTQAEPTNIAWLRNIGASICGILFLGLLFFPSPDFSKSFLVGILFPTELFPQIISSSLLFWSFLLATLGPVIVIMNYDSFKRR